MLTINLQRIFQLRGIKSPYTFLVKLGVAPATARNWARNEIGSMRPAHFTALCTALNCTPNDLFEWRAGADPTSPETHALRSLVRPDSARNVAHISDSVPVE
jgi:DNA-binding Xre family transcriptional regulator